MLDTFYILESTTAGNPWYQLIIKDSQFCISSGPDFDHILEVLKSYVKRYRTREKLLTVLDGLESRGRVNDTTYEQRREAYLSHGDDYDSVVESTIREAIREMRQEDKAKSPLTKAQKRLSKAGNMRKHQTHTEKVDSTPVEHKTTLRPIRKRIVVIKH